MVNNSGSLGFSPVLHNITPEKVVFVYNKNKEGSLEVAQYYQSARNIPSSNIIGLETAVPINNKPSVYCEDVISKEDYVNDIEIPLISAIKNIDSDVNPSMNNDSGSMDGIWVIILGYGIPICYSDNGEYIAIASKLHRLGKTEFSSHKSMNHTFDRRGRFKFFDSDDASKLFITAVLDGPTVNSVKKMIDRSLDVDNQTFITGKIYVDPYGLRSTQEQIDYQNTILDFIENECPYLGLDVVSTINIEDPYKEPTVAYFDSDSFYWGWFNPTYSKQLFLNQNQRRCFLYNADYASACGIHFWDNINESPFDEDGSDPWCNIAINVEPGYASCAGSVDYPGDDAYLSPRPFFEALHQGATIGESFLFASKYVDWKTIFIGDPLMVVNFPIDIPSHQDVSNSLLPNNEVILRIKNSIEKSLGWAMRQSKILEDLVDYTISGSILKECIALLHPVNMWKLLKSESSQTDIYYSIVSSWLQYLQKTTGLSLSDWLIQNNEKISARLYDVVLQTGSNIVSSSLIFSRGYWQYEFQYIHKHLTLQDIYFVLEVFSDSDMNNLVFSTSSLENYQGWKYEKEAFVFDDMPETGFPSNFSYRRVKYMSSPSEFLASGEIYYIKWKAVDEFGANIDIGYSTERVIVYA